MDAAKRLWEKTCTNEVIMKENLDIYQGTWGQQNWSMAKKKKISIVMIVMTFKKTLTFQINRNLKKIFLFVQYLNRVQGPKLCWPKAEDNFQIHGKPKSISTNEMTKYQHKPDGRFHRQWNYAPGTQTEFQACQWQLDDMEKECS